MLWCCSHLVWLVFEGSIPTCAGFHLENFFVTCVFANPRNTTYNDLKGDHQIATTVNTLNMHKAKTLHLGEEEPAGLTMLGIIVVRFADILS